MRPFIVFSLPRSRSTWLSLFLSYGGRQIGHDIGVDCRTREDFLARLGDGTCETGAAFAWRRIRQAVPDCRFALVYRPIHEVCASLERFGLDGWWPEMQKRLFDMDEIARETDALIVDYHEMDRPEVCERLFEFCLGEPLDIAWWARMDAMNIQTDMPKQIAKLVDNRAAIEALKADVRRRA